VKIILARHGNTFAPNEPATWVGCKNDLPLVNTGIIQAKTLGRALKEAALSLHAVYCSPLQRTLNYAEIALHEMHSPIKPIIDPRLNELDYGAWTGLTNEEVREKLGAEEIECWEKYYKWPQHSGWDKTEQEVRAEAMSFANDLLQKHHQDENILVVSSNGKLRYFLNLVIGEYEKYSQNGLLKVKTGNICGLTFDGHQWSTTYWNKLPDPGLFCSD